MPRLPTALLALLLALSALPAGAAPQIPARLDVAAARIVVDAPLSGQYLVVCQTAARPEYAGPWALEVGAVARFEVIVLNVPCWVQAVEDGETFPVWRSPHFTLWGPHRVDMPMVNQ